MNTNLHHAKRFMHHLKTKKPRIQSPSIHIHKNMNQFLFFQMQAATSQSTKTCKIISLTHHYDTYNCTMSSLAT